MLYQVYYGPNVCLNLNRASSVFCLLCNCCFVYICIVYSSTMFAWRIKIFIIIFKTGENRYGLCEVFFLAGLRLRLRDFTNLGLLLRLRTPRSFRAIWTSEDISKQRKVLVLLYLLFSRLYYILYTVSKKVPLYF